MVDAPARRGGLRGWLRRLRGDGDEPPASLRDELEELIEEHGEAEPIDPEERALLTNILRLHEVAAADIMVPRLDIVALPVDMPFAEAAKQMAEHGHSRLPLYRETLDDVVGVLHIKDLLPHVAAGTPVALDKIARKALFAAPTLPVLELLKQMRASRLHLALVVDEFGGVDGLITIEDVIEEIVGEIEDEHDEIARPRVVARPDGTLIADARAPLSELAARVKTPLLPPGRAEGIDTLGGLVFALAGRVPGRGEVIQHPAGFSLEVLEADPRRVRRLRIKGLPTETGPHG
ncbi:MAG: HlyC/CorC family transporter [Alphaproteobacteria bacterium]|nr:hemolysin family protein [Alphaproteobacteria bacterium]MDE1967860.1 HlyC/CorC family transporter [Alphaproteobacteria bacterium]MDE2514363.1 HlyC/CorC family transporter [Alphaproteobacteria bacterium]